MQPFMLATLLPALLAPPMAGETPAPATPANTQPAAAETTAAAREAQRQRVLDDLAAAESRDPGALRGLPHRQASFLLSAWGYYTDAEAVLMQVVERPASPFDAFSARRMLGDLAQTMNRPTLAEEHYTLAIALYDADPAPLAAFGSSVGSVLMRHSFLLLSQGRLQEADALAARVTDELPHLVDPGTLFSTIMNRARIAERMDRPALAAAFLDRALTAHADELAQANAILSTRLRALRLRFPEPGDANYIAGLTAMWNDAAISATPESLEVAVRLYPALQAAGLRAETMQFAWSVVQHIDANRERWLQPRPAPNRPVRRSDIDTVELGMLSNLCAAEGVGMPELAIAALQRLRARETDPKARAEYDKQIAPILIRMQAPQGN